MRALLPLALIVPILWAPAGASQGGGAAGEPLLTDPAGDAMFAAVSPLGGVPAAPASQVEATRGCDLISLALAEGDDALHLTIGVAAFSGDITGTSTQTYLDWNGKEHRVLATWYAGALSTSDGDSFAYVQVRDGDGWSYVAELDPPVVDVAAATISVHVPKVFILDGQHRMPGIGDTLVVERVLTDATFSSFGLADLRVQDAMPDAEGETADYVLQRGDFATGSIVLTSEQRVRVSNGGATTFVFPATIRNPGEAAQEYALTVPDLPPGWNATLPAPVTVAAKEERTVNLLVSVPFAHEHGGFSSFNLTVKGTRDAGTEARMRMGVLHTPIPQPAGHHSELYLHAQDAYDGDLGAPFGTAFPFAWGWMNTVSDHADDAAYITTGTGFDGASSFFVPLNPRLMMGLDFDLERVGTLDGAIMGGTGDAQLRADLYYWSETHDDGILLAEGEPVPITLDAQNEVPFSITLTPTLESDYLAYEPEAYLYLVVAFENTVPDVLNHPARPKLMTAPFKLALPLNEYHDKLTGVAEAAQSLDIVALGLVEKSGLPGSVLTYPFTVRNNGPDQTFTVEVAGNGAHAARVVPNGDVFLASGETREVLLAVEIPVRAADGQELEALLFVHARDDPTLMAIARTKTRVTTAADQASPDETGELLAAQARENEAPGLEAVFLLSAVALVALALGRRAR